MRPRLAAYVYTGWHPVAERDQAFHPGFTEWELVRDCRPRFEGHVQPRVPLLGEYDDRDPEAFGRRIDLARDHGIDALVFGVFWCRGKRVFERGLRDGFLDGPLGRSMPFACMWANRMPRRVLPVRRSDVPVIDPARHVETDVDDFVAFLRVLADEAFGRPNYLRVGDALYFSIFDSSFFLRELGLEGAREALKAGREELHRRGLGEIHFAAIEPNAESLPLVREVGFDSVTHYVLLPDWKGPFHQDYREYAELRAGQWASFAELSGLPYMPAVTPGWDASPRGADFGDTRPDRYPWSPVVVGESPEAFAEAVERALRFQSPRPVEDPLVLVASLNEWSEGHVLEPCERFGKGFLEAIRSARTAVFGDE